MAISSAAAIGATLLVAILAFIAVPAIFESAISLSRNVMARARMRSGLSANGILSSAAEVLLEGGLAPLSTLSSKLLKIPFLGNAIDGLVSFASWRGISSSRAGMLQCSVLGTILLILLCSLLSGSLFFGFVVGVLALGFAVHLAKESSLKRLEEMDQLLPDALRAVGVYYSSGLGLRTSLEQVALETPGSLGELLGNVAYEMKAGKSLAESLDMLKNQGSSALSFLAVAIEIQQRTGGSLQPVLESVAESVSDSNELKRSLQVKTAQARMSAKIVAIMPIVLFLILTLTNPSMVLGFFSSTVGVFLFFAACAMELLGILIIRRILAVDGR